MTRAERQRLADEDLMPLVAREDPVAFEVFYDRHAGAAYSLAYRIVGNRSAAEDVTQEALISIWRAAPLRPRPGSVRAWTLGIVRNRAIDLLRKSPVAARSRHSTPRSCSSGDPPMSSPTPRRSAARPPARFAG
jgi:RNA polymerase sigma-70 factor (ECF subfamily)